MSFGKISIRKSDKLFRQYLLKLRNYTCEATGQKFPDGKGLVVSHFYGRRHENTRYSEINCDLVSIATHNRWHERPAEYTEWKLKKLGRKEFDKLKLEANIYKKRDDKLVELYFKKLLENENRKKI